MKIINDYLEDHWHITEYCCTGISKQFDSNFYRSKLKPIQLLLNNRFGNELYLPIIREMYKPYNKK